MLKPVSSHAPRPRLFARFGLLAGALFLCGPAHAQDAAQTSSGELTDFRLDNPPPKEKEAEPAPKVEAAIEQPKVENPPKPDAVSNMPARKADVAKPKRQQDNGDGVEATTATEAETGPAESAATDVPQNAAAAEAAPAAAESRPAETATAMPDYLRYWPLLLALLAALAGWAVFALRKKPLAEADEDGAAEVEALDVAPVPTVAATPPSPPKPAPQKPACTATLHAEFAPDNARLSVANLTVTGRLIIRYQGNEPLEILRLRTLMISACDDQKNLIQKFHSDALAGQVNSLGPVAPGEEIKMKLELQLPRDALQAFDWRERRFVAPIILINVDGDGKALDPVQITSLVGQQGVTTADRLQPIPIDRGPKLFDALQFRPIAA